jgi:hypothetical protein
MTDLQRWQAYQAWINDILRDYPGCDITETRTGVEVTVNGESFHIDYEPDPHSAARDR